AAWMSATNSATLAAVKLAGTVRSSSRSRVSRVLRRGVCDRPCRPRQRWNKDFSDMVHLLSGAGLREYGHRTSGAQTERRGGAEPAGGSPGAKPCRPSLKGWGPGARGLKAHSAGHGELLVSGMFRSLGGQLLPPPGRLGIPARGVVEPYQPLHGFGQA